MLSSNRCGDKEILRNVKWAAEGRAWYLGSEGQTGARQGVSRSVSAAGERRPNVSHHPVQNWIQESC